MKPPKQCDCQVHQTADYSTYSPDQKLLRRVRRNSLEQAGKCRQKAAIALQLDDREEANYQEGVAVCAEWEAYICLLILREIRTGQPVNTCWTCKGTGRQSWGKHNTPILCRGECKGTGRVELSVGQAATQ